MASNNVETEIKLAISDPQSGAALLTAKDFQVVKPRVFESNVLFDTSARTLRASGCMLRVRSAGPRCILTFKGDGAKGRHKVREEIEVHLPDAVAVTQILDRIGYLPAFRYEKYRTEFARPTDPGIVTLDETPIGFFLELEGPPDWIDRTANELGFDESQYITASYGALYLQHCASIGETPAHMVFANRSSS